MGCVEAWQRWSTVIFLLMCRCLDVGVVECLWLCTAHHGKSELLILFVELVNDDSCWAFVCGVCGGPSTFLDCALCVGFGPVFPKNWVNPFLIERQRSCHYVQKKGKGHVLSIICGTRHGRTVRPEARTVWPTDGPRIDRIRRLKLLFPRVFSPLIPRELLENAYKRV